jgi:predicted TIM-barrel fold metal-dependent hydrolase
MEKFASTVRVDTHFHVFEAGVAVPGARYVPSYSATIDHWWRCAESRGVSRGVLVQPSFLGTDNRLLRETLVAYPGRLKGVAVVNPQIARESLVEMDAVGVRGIRLNLVGGAHDMTQWAQAHSLWDQLLAMNWHVELHTDRGRLPDVLPQLPSSVPVVIDHMGRPLEARADDPTISLLRKKDRPRVMVKLSGAYRLGGLNARDLAQVLLEEIGPTALLWGSDWPCTNHEDQANYASLFDSLTHWVGEDLINEVLCVNPMRLFWGVEDGFKSPSASLFPKPSTFSVQR